MSYTLYFQHVRIDADGKQIGIRKHSLHKLVSTFRTDAQFVNNTNMYGFVLQDEEAMLVELAMTASETLYKLDEVKRQYDIPELHNIKRVSND